MGTTKVIEAMENIIAHLIGIGKSAEVLALREDEPHNMREIRTIVDHAKRAKDEAVAVRNQQKKDKDR